MQKVKINEGKSSLMGQRIEFIDLAKGICILLVVSLHVFGATVSGKYIGITNMFRMPLYFLLSGLFFKTYGGILPFFKKKTNKLLIPFVCSYIFVILPISCLLQGNVGVILCFLLTMDG